MRVSFSFFFYINYEYSVCEHKHSALTDICVFIHGRFRSRSTCDLFCFFGNADLLEAERKIYDWFCATNDIKRLERTRDIVFHWLQ